ncbi:MAG: hypothetical protein IK083_07920 [Abditibacteriota bacterium]|nr:hypothetical protein [Abditibacteriota bacterium]
MKKAVIISLIALFIIGALVLYGSARGNKVILKDTGAARTASEKNSEQAFEAVDINAFDKTGICADFETMTSEEKVKAGTKEDVLPVNSDTSVIFQNVCETGLNEAEIGAYGKKFPYSVRNTLNIYLENKNSRKRDRICSFKSNYTEENTSRSGHTFNYPYVLDAEVSNDGKMLRFLVRHVNLDLQFRQYDLHKKSRPGQEEEHPWTDVYDNPLYPNGGGLVQAYFVKPDVINVFTTTMDYSVQVKMQSSKLYRLKNKIPLTAKLPDIIAYCDCIYWNGKGNYDYITSLVYHPKSIGEKPPVPTEKDWEGWHKLERTVK